MQYSKFAANYHSFSTYCLFLSSVSTSKFAAMNNVMVSEQTIWCSLGQPCLVVGRTWQHYMSLQNLRRRHVITVYAAHRTPRTPLAWRLAHTQQAVSPTRLIWMIFHAANSWCVRDAAMRARLRSRMISCLDKLRESATHRCARSLPPSAAVCPCRRKFA
jgi:hypothetical protein